MISIKSIDRVKAAMYFNNSDKVPVFSDIRGDICPMITQYSNEIPVNWWEYPVSENWDNYNVPPLPRG